MALWGTISVHNSSVKSVCRGVVETFQFLHFCKCQNLSTMMPFQAVARGPWCGFDELVLPRQLSMNGITIYTLSCQQRLSSLHLLNSPIEFRQLTGQKMSNMDHRMTNVFLWLREETVNQISNSIFVQSPSLPLLAKP